MSSNNSNNLSDFLGFESKHQKSSGNDTGNHDIVDHALDQLLEAKLGNEITLCAKRLAMGNISGDISSSFLEEEVEKLMESSAYQKIYSEIKDCSPSLLFPNENEKATDDNSSEGMTSNEKSKESIDATNKPAAATTSFSLFDLMDSQKGDFTLPPRIMAHQVINAYQRDNSTVMETTSDTAKSIENNSDEYSHMNIDQSTKDKSALELLEKAEDMEDLSPDIESWEQIRSILYRGLVRVDVDERRRYFDVHHSLFEKCCKHNNGGMFRSQTWGLTNNIVGLILFLSAEFEKDENILDLDLYWDSCHHLLSSLSHLAVDYVKSSVGNEKEIERMLLGLSYILCNDVSACVLAMMEPIAGWFEVWARFVERRKLMGIVSMSGLVEVALKRYEGRGKNGASKRLCELLHQSDDDSESPTLEDVENSNVLQSLSLLRVIVSRCDIKSEIIGSINPVTLSSSSFLGADGIISCEEVQTMLEKRVDIEMNGGEEHSSSEEEQHEMIARFLKPFNDILLLNESTPGAVDTVLEKLCTQTVSLVDQLS